LIRRDNLLNKVEDAIEMNEELDKEVKDLELIKQLEARIHLQTNHLRQTCLKIIDSKDSQELSESQDEDDDEKEAKGQEEEKIIVMKKPFVPYQKSPSPQKGEYKPVVAIIQNCSPTTAQKVLERKKTIMAFEKHNDHVQNRIAPQNFKRNAQDNTKVLPLKRYPLNHTPVSENPFLKK